MKTYHLRTGDVRPGRLYRVPSGPDNVMLDLTWACNFRCSFCYNALEDRRKHHPDDAVTHEVIERLAAWGVREILYLGGEPTLHPDFDGVLEHGAALGLRQRMVTNGSRIDDARARRIARLGVEVGVSLHGSRPEVHDALTRVQGSFSKARATLRLLVAAGAGVFVQYSPTRSQPGGLPSLACWLEEEFARSIRYLDVNRLLPFGEGGGDGLGVTWQEDGWWRVLREAGVLRLRSWGVRVESVPRCWVRRRSADDGLCDEHVEAILACLRPCWMGVSQLAFDPAGRVKLCPGGPPLGPSILDVDPAIWWKEHPLLVERRQVRFLPTACVDYDEATLCDEFYECGGGCRGAAGDALGKQDPLQPAPGGTLTVSGREPPDG